MSTMTSQISYTPHQQQIPKCAQTYHFVHLAEEGKDEGVEVEEVEGHDACQLPLQLVPGVAQFEQTHQLRQVRQSMPRSGMRVTLSRC